MAELGKLTLALDASQPSGSLALFTDGSLSYCALFDIKITHSETLMPQLDQALKFCGFRPQDISQILLANGPGSFTGLRIGLATAKGIAYALKCPLQVFSSLQLAALPRYGCGKKIVSVIDARMQEVYAAIWDSELNPLEEPCVCLPSRIPDWDVGQAWVLGSGAALVPKAAHLSIVDTAALGYVPAVGLGALAKLFPDDAGYDFDYLAALEPFYLRDSSAQIKSARQHRESNARTSSND